MNRGSAPEEHSIPLEVRVSFLKDIVELLEAIGDGITKITDGFAHVIRTGVAGYDAASARFAKARLYRIHAELVELQAMQSYQVLETLGEFLRAYESIIQRYGHNMPEESTDLSNLWNKTQESFDRVLDEVKKLLEKIKTERSDFIIEESYSKIVKGLHKRRHLLEQLGKMPAPLEDSEVKVLREMKIKYDILMKNLGRADRELSAYLARE